MSVRGPGAGRTGPDWNASELVGRVAELARVQALLERGRTASQLMAITGDPGMGKSAILASAVRMATALGALVLTATGVENESDLAFAGLHLLLRPVMKAIDALPPRQSAALRGAFGLGDDQVPERFLVGLATLTLLSDESEMRPVVVVLDDAPWIDPGSLEAVAFAARRLDAEPVTILVASRTDEPIVRFGPGVDRLVLGPLTRQGASDLIDAGTARVTSSLRAQILSEAAGNPLAVIELAAAHSGPSAPVISDLGGSLAPTARLERVFGDRLAALSDGARRFLILAATYDRRQIAPVLAAAELIGVPRSGLVETEDAGLIAVSGDEFQFRHPMIRSVAYHGATLSERRAAHEAFAALFQDDPDRRAWHRAATAIGNDEDSAAALEASAARSSMRAGYEAAEQALVRAAALSPSDTDRARRLVLAAEAAFTAGRGQAVLDLSGSVETLTDDPHLRARAGVLRAYIEGLTRVHGAAQVTSLAYLQETMTDPTGLGIALLATAAGYSWTSGDRSLAGPIEAMVRGIPGTGDEPWRLYVLAATDPMANGPEILPHVEQMVAEPSSDPGVIRLVPHIPFYIDRPLEALELLDRTVDLLRSAGSVSGLPSYLAPLGIVEVWLGRWQDARTSVAEAIWTARESGQPVMASLGVATEALIAALQGRRDEARQKADETIRAVGRGVPAAIATWALGLDALAHGQHEEAFVHLARLHDQDDPVAHADVALWSIGDLVESSIGDPPSWVEDALTSNETRAAKSASARARIVTRRARAMLAPDPEAEALFELAANVDGTATWPFEQARTQLRRGAWLRRHRRIVDSRPLLRQAHDTFSRLGAAPWADRVREELRAAGVTAEVRRAGSLDELTPQQRQIALLAAHGMSNREIAGHLFLSPRTVAFHLYNIFPKLGIRTRSQLALAMDSEPVAASGAALR